ncbi:Aste57867_7984 [Aphanomyces stellatus]|uniref:Aste57867_7984 protein n=1 Tax=Aphanomyces stellatus TaxID=120398 RepID=A0A485KJ44_9STRA|nr:hypothetical protein As57867_007954 [Aphanomyces stellatus]VFT84877.1 Aste57867_7984 [Aphanomyces stellatus]
MNRVLARRCAVQLCSTSKSTRRFNTSANSQGQGATQGQGVSHGTNNGHPRGDDYEWARQANEFGRTFNQFSTNAYAHAERNWGYKGPFWGFTIGAFVGYFSRPNATSEDETRRMKSLARDLQDETRDLKIQLVSVQQSVDALRSALSLGRQG